ncbi:asparaginase [Nocardia sp. NPDC001965]
MTEQPNSRVLLLGLGGTISMIDTVGGDARPTLRAAELIDTSSDSVRVDVRDLRIVPGVHLDYDDIFALAHEIKTAHLHGYQGVVITQGTDTIEEVAYALTLLVSDPITVVVTGAMRSASAPSADGGANLAAAIAVAADRSCAGAGVLVVLGDEIHSAAHVRKTNTTDLHAFQSWPGRLGYIHEGEPYLELRPAKPPLAIPLVGLPSIPRIEIITALFGGGTEMLNWLLSDPPDALVLVAFGGGHVHPSWVEPLATFSARHPVVLCSRVGSGRILSSTYAFPGSEQNLLAHGLIAGGWHDPIKAAVALTLLLTARCTDAQIRSFFER